MKLKTGSTKTSYQLNQIPETYISAQYTNDLWNMNDHADVPVYLKNYERLKQVCIRAAYSQDSELRLEPILKPVVHHYTMSLPDIFIDGYSVFLQSQNEQNWYFASWPWPNWPLTNLQLANKIDNSCRILCGRWNVERMCPTGRVDRRRNDRWPASTKWHVSEHVLSNGVCVETRTRFAVTRFWNEFLTKNKKLWRIRALKGDRRSFCHSAVFVLHYYFQCLSNYRPLFLSSMTGLPSDTSAVGLLIGLPGLCEEPSDSFVYWLTYSAMD